MSLLEVPDKLKLNGYLVAMNIEKTLNLLDHDLIVAALEKFGFKSNFIDWIKFFQNWYESCVINGGTKTE